MVYFNWVENEILYVKALSAHPYTSNILKMMAWYHIEDKVQLDAKLWGLSHVFAEKIERNNFYNAGQKVLIFSVPYVVLTL